MHKDRKSNVRALAEARMEMRVSPQDKALINQAASLKGSNATAFVLASALAEARRMLGENSALELSAADLARLRTQTADGAPTPLLAEALNRHRGLDGALARLFQRLEPGRHDVARFDCGDERQTDFLQRHAATHERLDLARVYVLTDALAPERVLGYYTLAAITVAAVGAEAAPLPALRLSRLALDRSLHGRGLGALLLADAIQRSAEAADQMPVYALVASPRDEREDAWFESYGFRRFEDLSAVLYLPLLAVG
ncbi:MAG: DUF1778 domain-containing protein [Stagnimonas sp.]|nr:DUF1778 domain-containing protein [Stagnimonas sp.]